MNEYESESFNVTRTCNSEMNEHKNTSITYDNEVKEKTLSMSDK